MSVQDKIMSGAYNPRSSYPNLQDYPGGSKDPTFRKARQAYQEEARQLETQVFKSDLLHEYAVEGNPKATRCFEIAWEIGHSSGLSEVADYFDTLVELIRE